MIYIGVNDHAIDLFEGQYPVPDGMSYNSHLILDQKTAVLDTVDARFLHEWLDNLQAGLAGRSPDYLIVSHMEPDHSANIARFMKLYPKATAVATAKAFAMMQQFFGCDYAERRIVVGDGDRLSLGEHTLCFYTAPMVHWPEVMVTFDETDGTLYSADAFGKFGARDAGGDWDAEARRYYIGIVGKYGAQVQALFQKIAGLAVQRICPLHGPMLEGDLSHYLSLYGVWSTYAAESEGILVAYTSVYGDTRRAAESLAEKLRANGCPETVVCDLARTEMSAVVADAFRLNKLVLATTTYNAGIFPFMRQFIEHLTERGYRSRTVAIIENGSWAPMAAKTIRGLFEKSVNLTFVEPVVTVKSAPNRETEEQLDALAAQLCGDYIARDPVRADKNDLTALFNIGYGLYVVTCRDGERDNALIVNAVNQVTSSPNRIAVTINKQNYSYHIIQKTGVMNLCCLSVEAPFAVFERFGFVSGRTVDKFDGLTPPRSDNGLAFLPRYSNSFLSLKVEQYVDLDTHGMFICDVTEARVISKAETMTYTFYQSNVKPKPKTEGKKGWVCRICGYVYEGEELPADFICPLCKHGAADFERIQ